MNWFDYTIKFLIIYKKAMKPLFVITLVAVSIVACTKLATTKKYSSDISTSDTTNSSGIGFIYNYKIQKIISNTPQTFSCEAQCDTTDVNVLMQYALDYTTDNLEFVLNSSGNLNVKSLDASNVANCIGYVTYYNAVLKKLLRDNHITNVKLQHARANIMIAGTDINKIFTDPSFKNHDISIVTINDTVYHIDPSLSEMGMSLIFQQ